MADNKGVLICGELVDGKIAGVTTELLGAGRKLASDAGEELAAVLIGDDVSEAAREAIAFGANKVYVIQNPVFKDYQTESFVAAMEKLCQQARPSIVLFGQTAMGRDLAPRLAFRLGTGLTTDCIGLAIDPATRLMVQTKPVYGGNAQVQVVCEKTRPQMATVRVKCMSPLERDDSRKGEVVAFDAGVDASKLRVKVLKKVKQEAVGVKLEDARVVVCGGRGLGGPENFAQLEQLAKALGGAVGASRPPCDSGWMPPTIQIGLTGKIVSPDVYFAVGISGASQHLAGCSGSKSMICINKDSEANIFKVCQFGVVGDYKKVLPPFIAKVKELLAG